MTDRSTRGQRRSGAEPDAAVRLRLSRIHRSGVCEPSAVRPAPTRHPRRPRPPSSCPRTRPMATTRTRPAYGPPYPPGAAAAAVAEDPKSPRWLWIVAGVAVLTVIGLVIALVIVNSSRQETVVAPLPLGARAELHHARTPTTTPSRRPPRRPAADAAEHAVAPPARRHDRRRRDRHRGLRRRRRRPGHQHHLRRHRRRAADRVQRDAAVEQGGRAAQPAEDSASVSIINVGREVTCSISVNGVQVQQRTGAGLTICTATG